VNTVSQRMDTQPPAAWHRDGEVRVGSLRRALSGQPPNAWRCTCEHARACQLRGAVSAQACAWCTKGALGGALTPRTSKRRPPVCAQRIQSGPGSRPAPCAGGRAGHAHVGGARGPPCGHHGDRGAAARPRGPACMPAPQLRLQAHRASARRQGGRARSPATQRRRGGTRAAVRSGARVSVRARHQQADGPWRGGGARRSPLRPQHAGARLHAARRRASTTAAWSGLEGGGGGRVPGRKQAVGGGCSGVARQGAQCCRGPKGMRKV
jgi:hypothetical protein